MTKREIQDCMPDSWKEILASCTSRERKSAESIGPHRPGLQLPVLNFEEISSQLKKRKPAKKKVTEKKRVTYCHTRSIYGTRDKPYRPRKQKSATAASRSRPSSSTSVETPANPDTQAVTGEIEVLDIHQQAARDDLFALLQENYDQQEGRTWTDRQQKSDVQWDSVRSRLRNATLFKELPLNSETCSRCDNSATTRCTDCGMHMLLCDSCDTDIHKFNGVHDRRHMVDRYAQGKSCEGLFVSVRGYGSCPNCRTGEEAEWIMLGYDIGNVVVITTKGRFDLKMPKLHCKDCEAGRPPTLEELVMSNLWPGHPEVVKGMYVIHTDVLWLYHNLKMHKPGLSTRSFISTLEDASTLSGRVASINRSVFTVCLREWRDSQLLLHGENDVFSICPACDTKPHAIHVDGNRKLYRFNKSKHVSKNILGTRYIHHDEEVDSFVKTIQSTDKKNVNAMCGPSHFTAAKAKSKTMRNLDETGLCVASCRHCVILHAINMHQGEIFPYPLFVLQHLKKANDIKFFCQDVICKFWPWLRCLSQRLPSLQNLISECKPFLSVMHGMTHGWTCQVLWGGRWQTGAGLTTGEEMELVNAYLSTAGHTTKYMAKAAREEELTSHMIWWNARKVRGMPQLLARKFAKVSKELQRLHEEVQEACINLDITEEIMEAWKTDVINSARVFDSQGQIRSGDADLATLKLGIQKAFVTIQQDQYSIKKVADGSQPRLKLRRKMDKTRKDLKTLIEAYNQNEATDSESKITKEMADEGIWPWLIGEQTESLKRKQRVADLHESLLRHREEISLLLREMKTFVVTLQGRRTLYREKIDSLKKVLEGDDSPICRGDLALSYKLVDSLTALLVEASCAFRKATSDTSNTFDDDGYNSSDLESDLDCDLDD